LEIIKNGSAEVWEHVNFHGEFDFLEEKLADSLNLKLPKILTLILDENREEK
jgi:hypothetical protein